MRIAPNKTPFRFQLGDRGEVAAAHHLEGEGYDLVEKNYRCPLGEIDLIAKKKNRLYFFEVKTRKNHRFGRPEEAVGEKKQHKIIQVAQYYLKEHAKKATPISFGVIAITWYDRQLDIKLIEHAFEAEET